MIAAKRAIVWVACVFAVALFVGACIGGPDCGLTGEIRSLPYDDGATAELDRADPVAEQRVTVRLNAAALPADSSFEATLLVLAPEGTSGPSPTPATTQIVPVRPFEVTVISEDTGTIVPATASWDERLLGFGPVLASIPIDCPAGSDCERSYRVRVAAAHGIDEAVSASWTVQARVTYSGVRTTCGIPGDPEADVETSAPVSLPSERIAISEAVGRDETGGQLEVRHMTVTAERAVAAASLRLSIVRPGLESEEDPAWRQWVRVFADDGAAPLADTLVGPAPYTGTALGGGTVDVPVLADCPRVGRCSRGYWIVFQSFAAAPRWAARGPDTPPPSLGAMTWTASAIASFEVDVGADAISVTIDEDVSAGIDPDRMTTASLDEVTVSGGAAPTAVDITFQVPERIAEADGLDPFGPSVAIVHVRASGHALQVRLDGPGAGPLTGYVNGDGATNLVAHPLDACPASGPCAAVVTLLAGGTLPWSESDRGDGVLDVAVDLAGAPPGSTIAIGEPYLLPASPATGEAPIAPILLGAVAAVLLVALLARRARRLARR
jgi:hypothetical protein